MGEGGGSPSPSPTLTPLPLLLRNYLKTGHFSHYLFTKSGGLQFGLVVTLLVRERPIGNTDFQIASGVGDDVNIEEYAHFPCNSDVSLKRQRTGDNVGIQSGVGEQAIRHQGESEVQRAGVAGANLARWDGDLADVVPSVPEESSAVGVLEADPIGVGEGDAQVKCDVQEDSEPSYVQ